MPLYRSIKIDDSTTLALWRVEETLSELQELASFIAEAKPYIGAVANEKRAKERLVARVLIAIVIGDNNFRIDYDTHGKPILNGGTISLTVSHTEGFVAVMVSSAHKAIGVDIELISQRVLRLSPRFMGSSELSAFNDLVDNTIATICWTAKEALYKALGYSYVDFKHSLSVQPFTPLQTGSIIVEDRLSPGKVYPLCYTLIEESYILSWSLIHL